MKTIIGVVGVAFSGKDTFGNHLVEKYGFQKLSFATPIKDMCRIAFGFSEEQLYGDLKETPDERYEFSGTCPSCGERCTNWESVPSRNPCADRNIWTCGNKKCSIRGAEFPKYVTPRLAMQTLGTEWGRRLCWYIWQSAAINYALKHPAQDRWVICDVRFRSEVDAILAAGGHVVRLLRGEARYNHQSEKELLSIPHELFTRIFANQETTPEEFYRDIDLWWSVFAKLPVASPISK